MKPTLKKLSYVLLVLSLLLTAIACKPAQYKTVYVVTQGTNIYYMTDYSRDGVTITTGQWWISTGWGYTKHTGILRIAGTYAVTTEQFQVGILK